MGVVREGCGGHRAQRLQEKIGFHSGYTGNPLKGGSSAWLLPGANRRQVDKSSGGDYNSTVRGCHWAGQGLPGGLDSEHVP